MPIETLGSIGEFVSGVAVVFSLLYVGYQIRQNTRTTQARAEQDSSDIYTDVLLRVSGNERLRKVLVASAAGKRMADLEPDQYLDVEVTLRAFFNTFSRDYAQYREGVSSLRYWQSIEGLIEANIIPQPLLCEWWFTAAVPARSYHPDFRAWISEALEAAHPGIAREVKPRVDAGTDPARDATSEEGA